MADTTSPQPQTPPMPGAARRGKLVSTRYAAELCNVHPNTIRRWIAEGRLPAYRVGPQRLHVDINAVAALIVPMPTP